MTDRRPDPRALRLSDRVAPAAAERRARMAIALLDRDGAARRAAAELWAWAGRWSAADARVRQIAGVGLGGDARIGLAADGPGSSGVDPEIDPTAPPSAHARMAIAALIAELARDTAATAWRTAALLGAPSDGLRFAAGGGLAPLLVESPGVARFWTATADGAAAAIAAHRYVQARVRATTTGQPIWTVVFDCGADEGGPMRRRIAVAAAGPDDAVRRARRVDRAHDLAIGALTSYPPHRAYPVLAITPPPDLPENPCQSPPQTTPSSTSRPDSWRL